MTGPLTDENGMIAGTAADVAAPAGWARRAAMQVLDALLLADGWDAQIIACASAIEAADKAATERAAVVAEQFSQSAHIAYSMRSGDFPKIARIEDAIAAAIRKGGDNGV